MPTASDPDSVLLECFADVPAPDPTIVDDATDNGPTPIVTWEDDTPSGTCPLIINRRYRVTDECGNFIFVTQVFTVVPATNPVVPTNDTTIVSCVADAQVQPAAPAVTDVCGNNLTPVITAPADVPCEGDMTWDFVYTDCAGNSSTYQYTYTVDYSGGLTAPTDSIQTVSCIADAVDPGAPADITDACGRTVSAVLIGSVDNPDPLTCEGTRIWTYQYTACYGTTTAEWTLTYTIDLPPFALPADSVESVVCVEDIVVATPPTITDQCGNPITPVLTENADPVCVGDKIFTFTYTDCAGNTADWTHTVSINDNIPPTGTAPNDTSIVLGDPIPPADPTLITDEADNCIGTPTVCLLYTSDAADE